MGSRSPGLLSTGVPRSCLAQVLHADLVPEQRSQATMKKWGKVPENVLQLGFEAKVGVCQALKRETGKVTGQSSEARRHWQEGLGVVRSLRHT